ncbi:MAG TPA: L-threonylcarbamoyladenylate synthase [Ignavibacteriaceae bacterium]|nr:L-threonylcarbamoyladenylate synthase [Ignavibacteriaceae bacterium]
MLAIKSAALINIDKDCDVAIAEAKKLYLEGSVFIYPTDTIYGLGANPFNEEAVKRIYQIKEREKEKAYIMLINSIENLLKYVEVKAENHLDFLLAIWPNPVSVVLNLNFKTQELLKTKTAAFRIPNHRFCLKLLTNLQMPLISTSVNKSGQAPLNELSLFESELSSEVSAIFYSKKKSFINSSTLIDLSESNPRLIREGKIKFDDLMAKFK